MQRRHQPKLLVLLAMAGPQALAAQGQKKRCKSVSESGSTPSQKTALTQEHQDQPKPRPRVVRRHNKRVRVKPAASPTLSLGGNVCEGGGLAVWPWETMCLVSEGPVIAVGTKCSGLEPVMAALDHVGLGGQTRLRFVCEKNAAARKLILAHQNPDIVYEDITKRAVDDMPSCDLYAIGLPCPPSTGVREGTGDRHGQGHFEHAVEYILSKTPRCFLLESAKSLTAANYRGVFLNMLATLRSSGKYVVTWRVVNTADHGIPQNRLRLYIIGLLRSALPSSDGL